MISSEKSVECCKQTQSDTLSAASETATPSTENAFLTVVSEESIFRHFNDVLKLGRKWANNEEETTDEDTLTPNFTTTSAVVGDTSSVLTTSLYDADIRQQLCQPVNEITTQVRANIFRRLADEQGRSKATTPITGNACATAIVAPPTKQQTMTTQKKMKMTPKNGAGDRAPPSTATTQPMSTASSATTPHSINSHVKQNKASLLRRAKSVRRQPSPVIQTPIQGHISTNSRPAWVSQWRM